jgi:PPOX class probable F420-dependent enzyme
MMDQLARHKYLNIETFRKSGMGVKTPVWFVQEDGAIFVRTIANSGKVKRIRNQSRVNIAPCKVDGVLLGEWHSAAAREVKDDRIHTKVDQLLDHKYGLMKKMFALTAALRGSKYTVLEIKPELQMEGKR